MKPDFLIIGAQKAGSTALMRYVTQHPDVYLPKAETRYFRDPWFQFEPADVLAQAVAPAGSAVSRRGIKCPDLLGLPDAPGRIHAALGEVDLLAVLRHPVDRAVSSYFWLVQYGLLPRADLDTGLSAILDGRWRFAHPRAEEVLTFGRYGEQVQRYREVFGANRLLVLIDADLRSDPANALLPVWNQLGVRRPAFAPAGGVVNEGVYAPSRLRFLALRQRFLLRQYPGFPGSFIEPPTGGPARLASVAVAGVDRIVLSRIADNSRPQPGPQLRARLLEYYRADLDLLERLIDRDLGAWRR